MQKFTRSLTREIEVGGERVAVTLDADGVTLRPVGSRRPPHTLSWVGVVCAAAAKSAPGDDQLAEAVKALKQGGEKPPAASNPSAAEKSRPAEAPAEAAPAATHTTAAAAPAAAHHAGAAGPSGALARIDAWLAKHRSGFHKGLLPGATDAALSALAGDLGGSLPDELRALLKWHNGQSTEVPGAFERSFFLLGAEQIAEAKKELDAEPRNGWKSGLIPVLEDEQDDVVCLDTTRPGPAVVEVWHGQSEPVVVAPSLTAWLEGFADALEKDTYYEDPERGSFRRKS
jgi:cell wall assembly regulator SMI1